MTTTAVPVTAAQPSKGCKNSEPWIRAARVPLKTDLIICSTASTSRYLLPEKQYRALSLQAGRMLRSATGCIRPFRAYMEPFSRIVAKNLSFRVFADPMPYNRTNVRLQQRKGGMRPKRAGPTSAPRTTSTGFLQWQLRQGQRVQRAILRVLRRSSLRRQGRWWCRNRS